VLQSRDEPVDAGVDLPQAGLLGCVDAARALKAYSEGVRRYGVGVVAEVHLREPRLDLAPGQERHAGEAMPPLDGSPVDGRDDLEDLW
jgi:hypothetical protein